MHNKGFSLLELTIVMAIIGILASIVTPAFFQIKLNKMNTQACDSANHFYTKAVEHFDNIGGNTTVIPENLNFPYYVLHYQVEATGNLVDTSGVITSDIPLTFKHKQSTTVYELSASGTITESGV